MRYDRDFGYGRAFRRRGGRADWSGADWSGAGEYGADYESPWDGAGAGGSAQGYGGGAMRSRGSYEEGARRGPGRGRDEFEWGGGYVGGRGYGGTNFDYEHGYRTGVLRRPRGGADEEESATGEGEGGAEGTAAATRGGYEWGEELSHRTGEPYGPARYGFGPYYQRLDRKRRDDDEIRQEVEEALFYDTWVDADAISVEVEEGIVTLKGKLPNYEEIRFATEDAWDVDGVRGVRTELRVEGRPRRSGRASGVRDDRAETERGESRNARDEGRKHGDGGAKAGRSNRSRATSRGSASGARAQGRGGRASNASEGRGEAGSGQEGGKGS
jgi:hypothetical protein